MSLRELTMLAFQHLQTSASVESETERHQRHIEAIDKEFQEAEDEAQVLDKKLADAEEELQVLKALKKSAEAKRQVDAKRKKLAEMEKQIAEARAALSPDGTDNGQRSRASAERVQPQISNLNGAQDTGTSGSETNDKEDVTTLKFTKPGKHGEWSELRAKQILGTHISHPLVQTTLNYCESFLTETMIRELKQALDGMPSAPWTLTELQKIWGGEDTDYFQRCTAWKTERNPRRPLSWNRYYYNGYLIHKHGGPSGPYSVDAEEYEAMYQRPLFDYGDLNPDTADGEIEPADLTNLYKPFLRTEHSYSHPCDGHEMGLLGSQDKCKQCGITGSVSDLD